MSELRDLYQEVIVDHARRPRNFRPLPGASCQADGYNPLCGDRVHVYAQVKDGRLEEVSFEGSGCAVSTASASMMTDYLKRRTLAEARLAIERFHTMLTGGLEEGEALEALGKLAVFAGVREFPGRVKCASLAWHSARAALEGQAEIVTTE